MLNLDTLTIPNYPIILSMLSHIVPHNRSSNYSKLSILSQSVYIIPYDPTLSDMIIAHYPIWSHISPYYLIFIHVIVHKKLSTNLQHILPEKKKKNLARTCWSRSSWPALPTWRPSAVRCMRKTMKNPAIHGRGELFWWMMMEWEWSWDNNMGKSWDENRLSF